MFMVTYWCSLVIAGVPGYLQVFLVIYSVPEWLLVFAGVPGDQQVFLVICGVPE